MASSTLDTSYLSKLLPDGHRLWGILESVRPFGEGLIEVKVSGNSALIPEEYLGVLQGNEGHKVAIVRDSKWYVGVD